MFYLKESHKADRWVFKMIVKVFLGIVLFLIFANGILFLGIYLLEQMFKWI